MRDLLNRGRRRKTLPQLAGAKVEFLSAEPNKRVEGMWVVTININGWPFDLGMWAKDELDIMRNVFALQRGEVPHNVFNVSK